MFSKNSKKTAKTMKIRSMDYYKMSTSTKEGKKLWGKGKGKGDAPPTMSPSLPSSPTRSCQPTSGVCLRSFDAMNEAFATARPNEVISICPQASILAETRLSPIQASGVTLCCPDANCIITLEDSTLLVVGDSFTISNIHISGGNVGTPGGQLTVVGGGRHLIESTVFENSASGDAAVYVETVGNLMIRNSEITGSSNVGLVVADASQVRVDTSIFSDNLLDGMRATWKSDGSRDLTTEGQDIGITNSIFTNNGATGLLATNMGTLPKLSVTLSFFQLNEGSGASFCCSPEYDSLELGGNSGFGNTASDCDAFLLYGFGDNESDVCLALGTRSS